MKSNPALAPLDRALGTWVVTGSHPYLQGRTLRGEVTFERIEGGAFVRMHSKMVDPEIPEGVAIFGTDRAGGAEAPNDAPEACTMLYFDERGVPRRYEVALRDNGFTWTRDDAEFAQRFEVRFGSANEMEGEGAMKKAGGAWEPDLRLSYARSGQ
jgi:hypothetical protein